MDIEGNIPQQIKAVSDKPTANIILNDECAVLNYSVVSKSLWPHGLYPGDSPGKNTGMLKAFPLKSGIKQGCPLLPLLFIAYAQC